MPAHSAKVILLEEGPTGLFSWRCHLEHSCLGLSEELHFLSRITCRRFLLDMPTEYVEVMPDAIGRILNDYPGMAGSHRLAFDGERRDHR